MIMRLISTMAAILLLSAFSWFNGEPETSILNKTQGQAFKPTREEVSKDVNHCRAEGNGLVEMSGMSKYLNSIASNLVKASTLTAYTGHVYIRATTEFGAASSKEGNIYVNYGLLRSLQNEDQVAAVIAHELAHILLLHHDTDALIDLQKQATTMLEWAMYAETIADAVKSGNPAQMEKSNQLRLMRAQVLMILHEKVISPSWKQAQESEADKLAADILVKANYNTDGLIQLLEMQEIWDKEYTDRYDPEAGLGGLLKNYLNGASITNVALISAATSTVASLFKSHPDARDRQKEVKRYLYDVHHDDEWRDYKVSPWGSILAQAETKSVFRGYEYAFKAQRLLEKNNLKDAKKYAALAVGGLTADDTYPLSVASQVLEASGDLRGATNVLKLAINKPNTSGHVYMMLAGMYSTQGNNKEALAIAKSGYKRMDDAPQFKPQMIRFYRLSGDTNNATLLTEGCAVGNPEFKDACRDANKNGT